MREASWRLIDSGIVSPPVSGALDEAILEAHSRGMVPNTLHFYIRSSPTVSVGHFQKVNETLDLDECWTRGVSIIRRRSGGRSIYTDSGQLIYAIVLSRSDIPASPEKSFEVLCTIVSRAISSFGVDARYRPVNDVEIGGKKVSGSAQLRRKGSVLQHGTVLVDTDIEVMDSVLRLDRERDLGLSKPSDRVTTLSRVLGVIPDMTEVKSRLSRAFSDHLRSELVRDELTRFEADLVNELVGTHYSKDEWNLKF
ncbi:MAG: lipoate--protein ligase family protein [Thermoplasmata archaeon]|nr:lipoate--protein ligase family protein [Thermoplasmata archaeon]